MASSGDLICPWRGRECRRRHLGDEAWRVRVWRWGLHLDQSPGGAPSLRHSGLGRPAGRSGAEPSSSHQPDQVSPRNRFFFLGMFGKISGWILYHTCLCHARFSTDEGQCWGVYNFTDDPVYFTGLASEPGARSMNVSLWGYRSSLFHQYWISFTIDFRDLITRNCEWSKPWVLPSIHLCLAVTSWPVFLSLMCVGSDQDYVQWLAHSDDISDPNDGCILGYKEKFRRLRKDSVCLNGRDYVVNAVQTPCLCTLDDFLW